MITRNDQCLAIDALPDQVAKRMHPSHQKSKTGISVASQMDMCPTKIKKKTIKKNAVQ